MTGRHDFKLSDVGPFQQITVENVQAAGFQVKEVNNLFLDVVKAIKATNPA